MVNASPSAFPVLAGLVLFLSACPVSAHLFLGSMTLDPSDLSVNQLRIQAASDSGPLLLAYESTGAVLSHRIELRFGASLEFTAVSTPPDWRMQSSLVNESGLAITIVTYYYTGNTAASSAEFFDFDNAWLVSFRLRDPTPGTPGTDPLTIPVSVEVNASSIVPGLGLLPASDFFSLAATLTSSQTQQPFSFRLEGTDPAGPTLRFNAALPGVAYHIECTEDLLDWSARTTFTTPTPLADHPVPLGGGWKTREFFRVLLVPLHSSP